MNATAQARQRSRVNTELESASRVREKNAALIRDWPDMVRMMFYQEGRQWYARSRRPGHLPHRIFHRVSGADVEVRCECEGIRQSRLLPPRRRVPGGRGAGTPSVGHASHA